MSNRAIRDYLMLAVFVFGTGFGAALIMRVAIGVSPWDALTQNLSELTTIKVGTMAMILNGISLVAQVLLKRDRINLMIILQIPMTIILGLVVNFAYYDLLGDFSLNNYLFKLLFYFIGQAFIAGSVGGIMIIDRLVFPVEGLCMVIHEKTGIAFVKVRQSVDVISVILVGLLAIFFKTTLTIREGTIIGMLIFSPMVGLFMNLWQKVLK